MRGRDYHLDCHMTIILVLWLT